MRIYEQFEKSLSAKENADFLKSEYGWGGVSTVIVGTGISEWHDGKGIHLTKGSLLHPDAELQLSWQQVEKRIGELIRIDRYLNPKEKGSLSRLASKAGRKAGGSCRTAPQS